MMNSNPTFGLYKPVTVTITRYFLPQVQKAPQERLPAEVPVYEHPGSNGMPRPHFQAGAKELEALFERHKDDAKQLAVLLEELGHRSTPKAITLKSRIARRLAKMASVGAPIITAPPRPTGPRQPELPLDTLVASTGKSPLASQAGENTTMGVRHPNARHRESANRVVYQMFRMRAQISPVIRST
jgi:hypothetical protein